MITSSLFMIKKKGIDKGWVTGIFAEEEMIACFVKAAFVPSGDFCTMTLLVRKGA